MYVNKLKRKPCPARLIKRRIEMSITDEKVKEIAEKLFQSLKTENLSYAEVCDVLIKVKRQAQLASKLV
jgi:nitrogen regulatory protein PII